MPRRLDVMSQEDISSVADAAKDYKLALYRLGVAAKNIIGKRAEDGTRYKDVLRREAVLDYPVANFAAEITNVVTEETILDYTIKELRDMLKEGEEEKTQSYFVRIKFQDKDEQGLFNTAVNKFSEVEGIDPSNANSFFVTTRAAEYLAEVSVDAPVVA